MTWTPSTVGPVFALTIDVNDKSNSIPFPGYRIEIWTTREVHMVSSLRRHGLVLAVALLCWSFFLGGAFGQAPQ